jgi:hypothetical protein
MFKQTLSGVSCKEENLAKQGVFEDWWCACVIKRLAFCSSCVSKDACGLGDISLPVRQYVYLPCTLTRKEGRECGIRINLTLSTIISCSLRKGVKRGKGGRITYFLFKIRYRQIILNITTRKCCCIIMTCFFFYFSSTSVWTQVQTWSLWKISNDVIWNQRVT